MQVKPPIFPPRWYSKKLRYNDTTRQSR